MELVVLASMFLLVNPSFLTICDLSFCIASVENQITSCSAPLRGGYEVCRSRVSFVSFRCIFLAHHKLYAY